MAAGRSFLDAAFVACNFQEIGDDCMPLKVRDINYSILPVYHSSIIPMRLFFKKYVCSFIYKLSFWSFMQNFSRVYIKSS